jgi:hypothetical protein
MSIRQSIRIHPVFLLGASIFAMSFGITLSQTVLLAAAQTSGVPIIVWAGLWMCISIITMLLGYLRSFAGDYDAR